jgi:hypothetical protein
VLQNHFVNYESHVKSHVIEVNYKSHVRSHGIDVSYESYVKSHGIDVNYESHVKSHWIESESLQKKPAVVPLRVTSTYHEVCKK